MMRVILGLVCALSAACGDERINRIPEMPPPPSIRIEPADHSVMIVNGAAITTPYTATLIDADGNERDVTDAAQFSLRDARYGTFDRAALTVAGQGAGPTRVIATYNGATGDTGLTVYVRQTIVDPDVAPNTPEVFGGAAEDPSLAPTVVYPLDRILVPPNLGQFDVHWTHGTADVFEIQISNQYLDIKRYTNGDDPAQPYWALFEPAQWYPIASSREPLALKVAGLVTTDPTRKGTAAAQRVDVTNEDAQGGIYYWTTSGLAGIWRYDVGKPEVPPAPYFADNMRPASCMGCHTLSRDGTKIAMTLDGGNGRGTVFNVADRTPLIPYDGGTQAPVYWNFATFNAAATKLVTIESSQLFVRAIDGAMLAGPVPTSSPSAYPTHPELSPDDKRLVYVEHEGGADWSGYGGSIVVRSFDDASNMFGPPVVLVAADPGAGVANFYPSFSPDGEWIAFTRTSGSAYDDYSAQAWVVKADGSQPPIPLTTANVADGLTNSWPRWVPFAQTFGPSSEALFYLTFSSKREFGVRIPYVGQPQIWMTPFFPERAAAGQDPSGPMFRVPFQDVTTSNHIAQWTEAVVVQ